MADAYHIEQCYVTFLSMQKDLCNSTTLGSLNKYQGEKSSQQEDLHLDRKCSVSMASLVAQMVKSLPAVQETLGSIPGLRSSPGKGNGNPLQYSCLENPMDGGIWQASWGYKEADATE